MPTLNLLKIQASIALLSLGEHVIGHRAHAFTGQSLSRRITTNPLPMPAKNGFELQDRDIELLNYVFQLRLAHIDHLSALSGRSVRPLWARLLKLKERRYLASVARFMQKQVYAIGSAGVPVLIEHGYAPRNLTDKRL